MKDKKKKDGDQMLDLMMKTMRVMETDPFNFLSMIMNHPSMKPDENDLGRGFRLVPDESIEDNREGYSHLHKDGVKVNDMLFRRGGLCSGFGKKDYLSLIAYPDFDGKTGGWGNHCIVDLNGQIVLMAEKFDTSFYYLDGVIAKMKDTYYNLLTKQPILKGGSSSSIKSKRFLFVENSYNKEYPLGVYKIEYATGNFEVFE